MMPAVASAAMIRIALCTFAVSSLLFSGCIVVKDGRRDDGHRTNRSALSSGKKRECHPSQYWDGHKCRHKGKGKGARKHDD